jgi:hypothetical protein
MAHVTRREWIKVMDGLMLHCGSEETKLADVLAVPVPEATDTWKPVAYGDAIDFVKDTALTRLGLDLKSESYGLNKNGSQLFARFTFDAGDERQGLAIGLRQSYNKSLANGLAAGGNVFVCDNLCFDGDAFKVIRKNTVNVWTDFRRLVIEQVDTALVSYGNLTDQIDRMRAIPCHEQRGYALLGVAIGKGLLTPNQSSVAFGDWHTARHEDFADRNLWSLYNCVTEGLKKGGPGSLLDRHAEAHSFFTELAA